MRLVSSATWTSGDPVSLSWVRYFLTMSGFADSNSVTFTQPPNDSKHSLFSYKRRRVAQDGAECQTGPGRREGLLQDDPGLDEGHAPVPDRVHLPERQHVVG